MLDTMMKVSLTLVAIDKMSRVIRDAVSKSESEFDKLQRKINQTSERLDRLGQNMTKIGAGFTAVGTGLAYKLGITEAIPEAIALEHQLRELGNVGQLSGEQLKEMDERLGSISRYTNQMRGEIAEGLNVLVASGIDPTAALDYMNVIGRTATAAQAEIVDISKTAFAVTDNLKVNVNDLGKTMDMLAQAGKEGRFELKDMSAAFPSLTAGASMLGMKGVPAVAQLGAALQVAMKGAGSAPEAATNFESFLQSITSPMAVRRFEELYGVDLPKFLNKVIAENKDPIEEMVVLINRLTGGDVFAVSEIFRNKTDLNFLKPMMQNLDEYRRIKASALGAEGIMDEDFNHMMETTSEQFKLLKINMKELVFPHLHKPIEKINELLTKINQHPVLQKGIFSAIIGTIGVGLVLTTLGTATMLVGKLVKSYGTFLGYARDLTPVLVQNSIKLLEFLGLNTTAHNLTFGRKIMQAGNPLGLDMKNFSLGNGLMADIRRIDKNLKEGIIKGFKDLPANISKSGAALKDWTITSIRAIPANFTKGLIAFKNGFLGIPSMIGKAIMAFRAFSVTLLTSPIGWIALAIGAFVFVIYKYWKPKVERITQNQERDLSFLKRLSEQYGYIFKIAEDKLVFYKSEKLISADSAKIIYKSDLSSIRLTEKTSHAYKSVSVAYRNPKTGKDVTATAKNPNCVKGDILKLSVRAENKQQALLQAKAALAKGNYTIEGSLSMPGNPYLVAGLNAELKDLGYFSGKYHITEAHHIIDKTSGYATSLEVKSC